VPNDAHSKFEGRLPAKDSCFFWLDYFCLRQCTSDFKVDCIIDLIKDIGALVAALDTKFEYVKRSCVLELYGAIHGDTNLLLHPSGTDQIIVRRVLAID